MQGRDPAFISELSVAAAVIQISRASSRVIIMRFDLIQYLLNENYVRVVLYMS
jgi:hypothetical protein